MIIKYQKTDNVVEKLYDYWEHSDGNIWEQLEDNVNEKLEKMVTDYQKNKEKVR